MELSTDSSQHLLMLSEHLRSSTVVRELWPVFQQRYLREMSFTAHSIQTTVCSRNNIAEIIEIISGRALWPH